MPTHENDKKQIVLERSESVGKSTSDTNTLGQNPAISSDETKTRISDTFIGVKIPLDNESVTVGIVHKNVRSTDIDFNGNTTTYSPDYTQSKTFNTTRDYTGIGIKEELSQINFTGVLAKFETENKSNTLKFGMDFGAGVTTSRFHTNDLMLAEMEAKNNPQKYSAPDSFPLGYEKKSPGAMIGFSAGVKEGKLRPSFEINGDALFSKAGSNISTSAEIGKNIPVGKGTLNISAGIQTGFSESGKSEVSDVNFVSQQLSPSIKVGFTTPLDGLFGKKGGKGKE